MFNVEIYIDSGGTAYGQDIVVNGDFAYDGNWTKGAGWTIGSGVLSCASGSTQAYQITPVIFEGSYLLTYTISNYSSGSVFCYIGGTYTSTARSANGTYEEVVSVPVANNAILYFQSTAFVGDIDNVSVKEVDVLLGYERLDTFNDENIQLTDSIQQARDPGNIFTAFTYNFAVPASKTNNKIFKHYYNSDIQDGYDARIRFDSIIKLNGADFKKGRIQLESVKMKMNKPYSYTLRFYGETVGLKETLKQNALNSLDLTEYDHDYDLTTVKSGLEYGLANLGAGMVEDTAATTRDVIYPLITHTKRYIYDSGATPEFGDTVDGTGLVHTELKPAIKINNIIDAIETDYSLTFSTDFFGDAHFDELYMWCNRDKGNITSTGIEFTTINPKDFTLDSGTNPFTQNNSFSIADYSAIYQEFEVALNPTFTGTGNWDIRVWDANTNQTLFEETDLDQTDTSYTFTIVPETNGQGSNIFSYRMMIDITSQGSISVFEFEPVITKSTWQPRSAKSGAATSTTVGNFNTAAGSGEYSWTTASQVNMAAVVPDMKIMDFLSGLFRMFNLVAYKEDDGSITVDTLDQFYAGGTERDITEYVDISQSEIEPVPLWDYIRFSYDDVDTRLKKGREEEVGERFGDKEYTITPDNKFGGRRYDIKLPFHHILMERLADQTGGAFKNHLYGWFVDEDEEPIDDGGKPLILYADGEGNISSTQAIDWDGGGSSVRYRIMGSNHTNGVSPFNYSTNWNTEIDELSFITNEGSLFQLYYSKWVGETYGEYARIVKVNAYLPVSFLLNYSLADKIIIHNRKYQINSIQVDLIDGKSSLELITIES